MGATDVTIPAGRATDCERALMLLARDVSSGLDAAGRDLLAAHLSECDGCREARGIVEHDGDLEALPIVEPRYYVRGRVEGQGGMGRVIVARDRRLGRMVALKEVLDAGFHARFEREIRVTARLDHPGIVTIHEAGRWPDGSPFLAMRWIDGETLTSRIAAASTWRDRAALVPHLLAVAQAIAYAHEQQVVHRDLKPGNVLVGPYGETVVIDWGLACDLAEPTADVAGLGTAETTSLTVDGAVMGTPAYMSPEQARGERVDERTDVFALGAILYHALTGRMIYGGASATEMLEHARRGEEPFPIELASPEVPPDLVAVVEKALAPKREHRYGSAKELADDLQRFQTGQLVGVHRYTTRELLRRWIRRHRAIVSIGLLAFAVIATLSIVGVAKIRGERATAFRERDAANSERAKAVALTAAMWVEQGRQRLVAGHPLRALPYLARAYETRNDDVVRLLVREAMSVLDVATWSVDPDLGPVARSRFSPSSEGRIIVTTDDEIVVVGPRAARVLDPTTGATRATLFELPEPMRRWSSTPDGRRFAVETTSEITVWDVPRREKVLIVPVGEPSWWFLAPAGDRVAHIGTLSWRTERAHITDASGTSKALDALGMPLGFDTRGRVVVRMDAESVRHSRASVGATIVDADTGAGVTNHDDCHDPSLSWSGSHLECWDRSVSNHKITRDLVTGEQHDLPLRAVGVPRHPLYVALDSLYTETGELIATFPVGTSLARIAVRGQRAIVVTDDDLAEVWALDPIASKRVASFEDVRAAFFAKDGSFLFESPDGHVRRVRDISTGSSWSTLTISPSKTISLSAQGIIAMQAWTRTLELWQLDGEVTPSVRLTADGVVHVAATPGPEIWWRGAATRVSHLATSEDMSSVAVSLDGARLTTATAAGRVRVMDTASWNVVLELDVRSRVKDAELSPGGNRIVTVGDEVAVFGIDGTLHASQPQAGAGILGMTGLAQHVLYIDERTRRPWLLDTRTGVAQSFEGATTGALGRDGTLVLGYEDRITIGRVGSAIVEKTLPLSSAATHIDIAERDDRALINGVAYTSVVELSSARELVRLSDFGVLFDRARLVAAVSGSSCVIADASTGRPLISRTFPQPIRRVEAARDSPVIVAHGDAVIGWPIALESRTPEEIARIVEARVPAHLWPAELPRSK